MKLIENILSNINSLPTLPSVYSNLQSAMRDPSISTDKISKIISSDQASAVKILRVANSPFYGFRGKIDTITQALLYLGFEEVKNIVFSLSVMNIFEKDKRTFPLKPMDLWAHSIGAGMATRLIGQAAGVKNVENYFLAGIFHDIGKVVLLNFAQQEYLKALQIVESKNCLIREAEKEVFGEDHSHVGKLLAEKWKLPNSICDSINHHHLGIIENENKLLVASVHLGSIIARALELGYAGDPFIPRPNPDIWAVINLPATFFASTWKKLKEDFHHTVDIMMVR